MALPGDLTTFTISFGPYTDAKGDPVLANVTGTLRPSTKLLHPATGRQILESPIKVSIDAFGVASVGPLPHTDNAALAPTGFTYQMVWDLGSNAPSPGNKQFAVPAASGTDIDFDLLTPTTTTTGVDVVLPSVISVAGLSGAPTAQQLTDALDGPLRAAFGSVFRTTSLLRGASIVASHSGNVGSINGSNGLSNGTDTSAVTRLKHKSFVDLADVRFVDANMAAGAPGPNDITLRRGVELPDGSILPVTWDGQISKTLTPGGYTLSDPLPIPPGFPKGTIIWTRTHLSVTAGGQFPVNTVTVPEQEEGVVANGATSLTTTGTVAPSFSFGYAPHATIGGTLTAVPSVAIVGDSIAAGQGDGSSGPGTDLGFIQRALFAANIGYLTIARPGERGDQFVLPATFSRRFAPVAGCTHVICEYGINDVNNGAALAAMQATALSVWGAVAGRGVGCFQTTLTPSSTSSNTVPASNDAARVGFNNWLRAGAPISATTKAAVAIGSVGALLAGATGHPLSGYFEVADLAETTRNSGLWKAGLSDDGTHPNGDGHPALAAGIDTDLITIG